MAKKKKVTGSLQDQLKAAGLVTSKQIRKANKGMHRQEMRIKQGLEVDENKQAVLAAQQSKQTEDRLKNQQIQQDAQTRALRAQIRQLIQMNSQHQQGDEEYNFTDQNKIKKMSVSSLNKTQLNKGLLAVVKSEDGYDLVPEQVAKKIMSRQADAVLYLYDRSQEEVDEDDPYKDFKIPDDLDW